MKWGHSPPLHFLLNQNVNQARFTKSKITYFYWYVLRRSYKFHHRLVKQMGISDRCFFCIKMSEIIVYPWYWLIIQPTLFIELLTYHLPYTILIFQEAKIWKYNITCNLINKKEVWRKWTTRLCPVDALVRMICCGTERTICQHLLYWQNLC